MNRFALVAVLCIVALPSAANGAVPDPDKFTPKGYRFCGWQDFAKGGWAMNWRDDLSGVYLRAFADGMSCRAARRNIKRYQKAPNSWPRRAGYRCRTVESSHEYLDKRCVKKGGTRKFRYQTGT